MNTDDMPDRNCWPVARFPSHGIRQEFLEQVASWNRVEALPTIATDPMYDGVRVRYWSDDWGRWGIERLIDSYGGFVRGRAAAPAQ